MKTSFLMAIILGIIVFIILNDSYRKTRCHTDNNQRVCLPPAIRPEQEGIQGITFDRSRTDSNYIVVWFCRDGTESALDYITERQLDSLQQTFKHE